MGRIAGVGQNILAFTVQLSNNKYYLKIYSINDIIPVRILYIEKNIFFSSDFFKFFSIIISLGLFKWQVNEFY